MSEEVTKPATALEAVEAVLAAVGQPLHYAEITKRMLDQGLWKTKGKTPAATVNAQLAVDLIQRGDTSCFQRTGKGVFGLRAWGSAEPTNGAAPLSVSDAADTELQESAPEQPGVAPAPVAVLVACERDEFHRTLPSAFWRSGATNSPCTTARSRKGRWNSAWFKQPGRRRPTHCTPKS
jgi:hypothetical protein